MPDRSDAIAIIGLGPGFEDAPWGEWECWHIADSPYVHRADVAFEIHDKEIISAKRIEELVDADVRTFMLSRHPDIPRSVEYPIDGVVEQTGLDYFCSTIDYMLALAVIRRPERVGIWGVSGAEEYAHQRVSIAAWIGVLLGRSVMVDPLPDWMRWVPPSLEFSIFPRRYGVLH